MQIKKIAFHAPLYKRPKVRDIFGMGVDRIRTHAAKQGIEVICITVSSPEDTNHSDNIRWAKANGFRCFEYKNQPLSSKCNFGLLKTREFEPDAVYYMGSDNLISNQYFDKVIELLQNGHKWVGCYGIYFADALTKNLTLWPGYKGRRQGEPIGAGRVITKEVLDRYKWKLWPDHLRSSLDGWQYKKLRTWTPRNCFHLRGDTFIVDIKSTVNMSKLDKIPNQKPVPWTLMKQYISEQEWEAINAIK